MIHEISPALLKDFYKTGHIFQYPKGTQVVYSNLTPRGSRVPGITHVVVFGIQYFAKEYLVTRWNQDFFFESKDKVVAEYKRRVDNALGKDAVSVNHIAELHDLGYLPLILKALPEGTRCPMRVPILTLKNTHPKFFWLTNFLETVMCNIVWGPCTSATTAYEYRKMLDQYAKDTSDILDFVNWQGHDFSMRGIFGIEGSLLSGAAHLLSFTGTDTVPAIDFLERYYWADSDKEMVGGSVPATEHSVMCLGGLISEEETFRRLLTEIYPTGIVSVVSDTWDYWNVITKTLPDLKDIIMNRNGRLVVRPDSGNPVKIICGDDESTDPTIKAGTVELLWNTFGGYTNAKGFKQLDKHIGVIYGDSITLERCRAICEGLKRKGFASTNMVFGIGSYCVVPETLILCSDLVWRTAGSLQVGQEIIAFDEDPIFGGNKHAARCYRMAKITANNESEKQCTAISTDIGIPVIASNDHPWLVWSDHRSVETIYYSGEMPVNKPNRQEHPRTAGLIWKKTCELKIGDKIAYLAKPWEKENTRDAGWLSGMYDGEGCVSRSTGDDRIPSWKINISQNMGPVLDKVRIELQKRGFDFYECDRKCPQLSLTGGWIEVLRFLGLISPERLLEKLSKMMSTMPALRRDYTFKLATVSSIELVGVKKVSSITTSSGTFITGGYLSHNTYQFVTRDTFGFAMKATWGVINGQPVTIYKSPKTDSGIKNSARGLLQVSLSENTGDLILLEDVSPEEEKLGLLKTVFEDGKMVTEYTLSDIRKRLGGVK